MKVQIQLLSLPILRWWIAPQQPLQQPQQPQLPEVCIMTYISCHQHSSLMVLMNAKADGTQILGELSKKFLRVPIRNQLEKADGIIFCICFIVQFCYQDK